MEATRPQRHTSPVATTCAALLLIFIVLFPKGGFRGVNSIPITWGYLLLAFITPFAALARFLAMPLRFPLRVLAVLLILLPMQALFVYAGIFYGVESAAFAFSTFVGLFALPWIFLVILGPLLPFVDRHTFTRLFCECVFWAAAWGIFLFFLHPLTGHFIEIPYLTVNSSDYGEIETTKSIARGLFYKLISTYNNGNLYGVSTLVVLPIFLRLETSRLRRATVRFALLLALSRTVWVGLVLNEMLPLLLQLARQVRSFPVLYLGAARRRFLAVSATLILVLGSVTLTAAQGRYMEFLLDPTVGGRIGEITGAFHPSFLPEHPLFGFNEVLYASAATYWGLTGLIAFTAIMFSPLLIAAWQPELLRSPVRRGALKGLTLYLVLAGIDGAFIFIPVMAFYWFVYAVFLYGWPGRAAQRGSDSTLVGSSFPPLQPQESSLA